MVHPQNLSETALGCGSVRPLPRVIMMKDLERSCPVQIFHLQQASRFSNYPSILDLSHLSCSNDVALPFKLVSVCR